MTETAGAEPGTQPRRRDYVPLLYRVAATNALLLLIAVIVTIVVIAPGKLSSLRVDEELIVLVAALILVVVANVYLVRRVVGPLQALTALARRVDLEGPTEQLPDAAPTSEAGELALTFNEMLARLARERREATGRVLAGQEAERLRIAQELHDQIGQELTAVLLGLSRVGARVPDELKPGVLDVQEAVRASLEQVRQIAIELRPEALDDLGLVSAIAVLCERIAARTGIRIEEEIDAELPDLPPEIELVLYRVAQEALTNVVRHSHSEDAELGLHFDATELTLTVVDRGRGLPIGHKPGTGMRGMRERAALIGARLSVADTDSRSGCEVRLVVPIRR